jgi:hypothetical protein
MGQQLLDPPSVEGWHTGPEWINTATLMNRINFAARQFADPQKPGVRALIDSLRARGATLTAQQVVDLCLDWLGPLTLAEEARQELIAHVAASGDLWLDANPGTAGTATDRICELLQMIVATREFQMA